MFCYILLDISILQIVLIILGVIVGILALLYFLGTRVQAKQAVAEKAMKQMAMVVSLLVIEKKKVHLKESGLMKQVQEAIPVYLRWRKFPVVKARIIKANVAGGAAIMTFLCDDNVFKYLPEKTEVKVTISGIYITKLHSAKGVDLSKLKK